MPDAVHMHVFDLYCKECGCRVQAGGDTYDEAKEAVVEKWNSRAERTCHPIEIFEEETFGTGIYFECSECHETLGAASRHGDSIPNYCPYCGARVAEE